MGEREWVEGSVSKGVRKGGEGKRVEGNESKRRVGNGKHETYLQIIIECWCDVFITSYCLAAILMSLARFSMDILFFAFALCFLFLCLYFLFFIFFLSFYYIKISTSHKK